jgi:hypothetical protein
MGSIIGSNGGGINLLGGAFSSAGSEGPSFHVVKPMAMRQFRMMKIKMKISYSAL